MQIGLRGEVTALLAVALQPALGIADVKTAFGSFMSPVFLLALMTGTAAVSTVMSDVPACAIFMSVALGIFRGTGIEPGSSFGRAVILGIPMASLIGGVTM